jgi:hypothetical protein
VFENRVLRGIVGPKREEVVGCWRGQHNGELYNLYALPNIIRLIKSTMVRWTGYVACMGELRKCNILV